MRIIFQADADLDGRILRGLLRIAPELNMRAAAEAGLAAVEDSEVLRLAAEAGRIRRRNNTACSGRGSWYRAHAKALSVALPNVSNRSGSRIWRMPASVTISNRRVRTRTHGGVAGVNGRPLPLCGSNALIVHVPY